MAVARVAARVAAGGHHVPEKDIRRRYERSVANFLEIYVHLANTWEVYDTSSNDVHQVARGGKEIERTIVDNIGWQKFTRKKHDPGS